MRLARIDRTLEKCEEHLSDTDAFGTEIESLLTQSLLVIMCAEFERKIKELIREKCSSVEDESIVEFMESCINAVFRSIRVNEISGLLNPYKERFTQKIMDNKIQETLYSNIITNRNQVAHAEGSNATFKDVKEFYEEGHIVLDFFSEALLEDDTDSSSGS
ncbi:MAG: HEPN domain-containing protein [Gemmatimonadetes bacterium]|nr:HEPN domain-containing protein [Gemmatimonadota bacterium]